VAEQLKNLSIVRRNKPSAGETTELGLLLEDIRACRVCCASPSYGSPLPHEPRPVIQASESARICIAGQAPGARVHASGRSYTDASGERLRTWLGLNEEDFYDAGKIAIVAMGFCFPGNDRTGGDLPPRRECAEIWRKRVFDRLPNIELMFLIGQYAQRWHLDRRETAGGVTETVRRWRDINGRAGEPRLIPLVHPSWRNTSWLKKNPWFEAELLPVAQTEVAGLLRQAAVT
jgi:uracil-DNA glycosylase